MPLPELREQTQHRWFDILTALGVDEKSLNKKHGPCLLCGGTDRARWTDYMGNGGFYCNQCGYKDGIVFLQDYLSQDFKHVAQNVRMVLGEAQSRPAKAEDLSKNKSKIREIWAGCEKLSKGDPSHLYLLSRGLNSIKYGELMNLRTHPGLTYWDFIDNEPKDMGLHPAMVALVVTADNKPATVQVTYLTEDGKKAKVTTPRKLMSPCLNWKGGAVRLSEPGEDQVLCVAEGVETALSLKQLHPEVCPWASLNADNMKELVPPEVTSIMVGGDNDKSFTGQAAAFTLANRLAKKKRVKVLIPENPGDDWNDELQRGFIK